MPVCHTRTSFCSRISYRHLPIYAISIYSFFHFFEGISLFHFSEGYRYFKIPISRTGVWWKKLHLDRCSYEFFSLPLSVSFHRYSIFTHVSSDGCTIDSLAAAVPQRHRRITSQK
jgi:hypothetical protein